VLFFIFLLLASLFAVSTVPAVVQAVDKPFVPQITVKLIDVSYDVTPTTSTDPYTGVTTTIPGYRRIQFDVVITIKNQPFTPSTNEKGHEYVLFYAVQKKGHFKDTWSNGGQTTFQSSSDYTTIGPMRLSSYDSGSQLDFRVRAVIGEPGSWLHYVYYEDGSGPYLYHEVVCSDWSSVQTVTFEYGTSPTVTATNTSPTSSSGSLTADPNTPSVSNPPSQTPWATYLLIIIVTVCITTIPLTITAYYYGQRKTKPHMHQQKQHHKTTQICSR
jgi:hypothetical protein